LDDDLIGKTEEKSPNEVGDEEGEDDESKDLFIKLKKNTISLL
jgi:hypothetical protein